LQTVRARAGETIAQIAARYHAPADEVARLNGFASDTKLSANQEIKVPASASSSGAAAPRRRR
ncbi:MAG: LysM peptidoglycan-binding domain-containing protein, partial [Pyrinomonadaceae bacterium]